MNSFLKVIILTLNLYPLIGLDIDTDEVYIKQKSIKLKELIQSLGPAYIKFGQILSMRYDFFHKETCLELQNLLDSGMPFEYSTLISILTDELKESYKLIQSIDKKPLAVASIGQVHKAKLKTGEVVVIKVQKPKITKTIINDMNALKSILAISKLLPGFHKIPLYEFVKEFEKATLQELDYENEANNQQGFRNKYGKDKFIYVPKIYQKLCTKKVIVMEYIEGIDLKTIIKDFNNKKSSTITIKGHKITKINLVKIFTTAVFSQTFKEGLFHGDPHPSNIFLLKNNKLAFLDFGLVVGINSIQIKILEQVLYDISTYNRKDFVKGLLMLSHQTDEINESKLLEKLNPYFDSFENASPKEYSPTKFLLDIIYDSSKLNVHIPLFLVKLAKVLAIYDGMLLMLDRNLNLIQILTPFLRKKYLSDKIDNLDLYGLLKSAPKIYASSKNLVELLSKLSEEALKKVLEDQSINIKNVNTDNKSKTIKEFSMFYLFFLSGPFIFLISRLYTNEFFSYFTYVLLLTAWLTILLLGVYKFLIKSK